jgi:hypothetical protein
MEMSVTEKYCAFCDEQASAGSRLIPKSKGGTDSETNKVPICDSCKLDKSDLTVREFYDFLDRKILQCAEIGTTHLVGRYGYMMFKAAKLIDYEEENWNTMFLPKVKKATNPNKRQRARIKAQKQIACPPKEPKPLPQQPRTPNYLEVQIARARAAGYDKLWQYEVAMKQLNPIHADN